MQIADDATPFDARPNGAARARRNEASQADAANQQSKKLEDLIAGAATLLSEPNQKLDTLIVEYQGEFRPAGAHQQMLVRELAYADWRIQQSTRIETGLLWLQVEDTYNHLYKPPMEVRWDVGEKPSTPPPPSIAKATDDLRTLLMGAAWIQNPKLFTLLIRYQNSARRDYFRALKQLEEVRTGKAGYLPKDPPPETKSAKPEPKTAANETNPNPQAAQPQPAAASAAPGNKTNPNLHPANSASGTRQPSTSTEQPQNGKAGPTR